MNPAGRDAILEYNIANGLVKSTQTTPPAPLPPVLVIDACPDDAPGRVMYTLYGEATAEDKAYYAELMIAVDKVISAVYVSDANMKGCRP